MKNAKSCFENPDMFYKLEGNEYDDCTYQIYIIPKVENEVSVRDKIVFSWHCSFFDTIWVLGGEAMIEKYYKGWTLEEKP